MDIQAQELFVALLSKLPADHHPIVIVIDAVDECTVDAQDLVQRMLFLMMDGLSRIACSQALRIFVTSRPEVHVERALQSLTFGNLQRFSLHDIPLSVVGGDIELYFQHAFERYLSAPARDALAQEYPDAIKDLTTSSMGLFIYAATIVEFLRSFVDEEILQGASHLFEHNIRAGKPALTGLADLYIVVLERAFPEHIRHVPANNTSMNTVLGSIAVMRDHITPRALAELAGMDSKLVNAVLCRIAPVIAFDTLNPDVLIRPLHASFAEFLVDPAQASRFQVDACTQHQFLAKRSLVLLMQRRLLSDFLDSLRRGETVQSSEKMFAAVRYACLYWPVHVVSVCTEDSESVRALVAGMIKEFCSSINFVVWMEILAHLAQLHIAAEYLSSIRDVLMVYDSKLAEILDDCYRLTVEFTPVILADPYQLVISALPQCRETSLLLQRSASTAPTLRTVLPRHDWSPWTEVEVGNPPNETTLDHHLVHVFPAPNGKWFAVYTRRQPGDVHLYDSKTARTLRTLHCHVDEIYDLDISPNSRLLVTTSSGREVHITDLRSGSRLYRLSDQSNICFVCFVTAFSGDEAILLAESMGHFRLWKFSSNRSEVQTLTDRADAFDLRCDSLSPRVRARDASQVMIRWDTSVLVWVDVHRDVVKTLHMPSDGHACLLGPYRALVCHRGSSLIGTYSLLNGELVLLRSEHAPFETSHLGAAASLDGDLVAIYNSCGNHYIWDSATSISQVQPLPLEHLDRRRFLSSLSHTLSISADGRYIYAVAAMRNSCRIVDLQNTRLHARNIASGNTKRRICVSADSSTVAVAEVAHYQVFVTAYRVADGLEIFHLTPRDCPGSFRSVALGANGKLLLLCYNREIQLWDRDGCIGTFGDRQRPLPELLNLEAAAMSGDATYIIGVGYRGRNQFVKSVVVWSVEGSTPPVVIDAPTAASAAYWPDSEWSYCSLYSVHIDKTLDVYLVSEDLEVEWYHAAFVLQRRVWSAAPSKVEISRTPRIPNERFTLHRDGWVTRLDDGRGTLERLCWIPPSRRNGENVRFHGHILPLLSDSGEVSFFDLSAFEQNAM